MVIKQIRVKIDNVESMGNVLTKIMTHYAEMMEQVKEGTLTIKDAE